jgi:hypothetical protein
MKNTFIDSAWKIQVVLTWAVTTNELQWTVSYYNRVLSTWVVTEWEYSWVTNWATPVDICAAPASWSIRVIKNVTVYNADTVSAVVMIQLVDAWWTRVLARNTLTTLSSWSLDDMSFYTDISWKLDTTALSDTAYWAWWNGDTTHTATKNAVYDKIETLLPLAWWTLSGTLTTDTIQLTEKSIKFDAALSADWTWCWFTIAWTGWETLAFWDLCYFKAADSKWYKVDWILDWTDVWFSKRLGMCVLAWASTTTEILLLGKIRADSVFPTLTIWAPVYADDTAWTIVVTQPSTTNFAIRVIGYGITADELWFQPDNTWIVHV